MIYPAPIVRHNLEANGGGESPFQYQSKAINLSDTASRGGYKQPIEKNPILSQIKLFSLPSFNIEKKNLTPCLEPTSKYLRKCGMQMT